VVQNTHMTKYRIVQRGDYYFAQKKIFNLFWIDCRWLDASVYGELSFEFSNDSGYNTVDNYIKGRIAKDNSKKVKVIKEYSVGD
jgi:hypothetical protein